jgi:choline dehydrogenase
LALYRRIESWQGAADPAYRGISGPVFVQPSPNPSPIAGAMLEAAHSLGIPTFTSQNGRMMEGNGGGAYTDVLIRDGRRHSIFRAYAYPYLDRPNLTVLTGTVVSRVLFEQKRAVGVEVHQNGKTQHIAATSEVVLSLGAIHTPKVLMQSGIGDAPELQRFGIPLIQHLPGVGQNLQDHVSFGCIWEYSAPLMPRNTGNEATLYWKSRADLDAPDLLFCQAEFPVPSTETARLGVPNDGWTMFAGLARPQSRGRVRLTSSNPLDPIRLDVNTLAHPDDMKAALACVRLARELGNSASFAPLVRREAMPGNLRGADLERFIRDAAVTYWHQTCTAKMGRDTMSVVDGHLRVYGVDNLRIVDGSIMPRVTTGNTMAPCVIIGERAAQILREEHRL